MPRRHAGVFIEFPGQPVNTELGIVTYYLVEYDGGYLPQCRIPCGKESDLDAISLVLRKRLLSDLRRSLSF
jgi:hypothetical protein